MILYIDTTPNDLIEIGLKDGNKFIYKRQLSSRRTQAEKLLPGIAKLLKANKLKLRDLKSIEAANRGGSFTSLRIGVVTANVLGYSLGIPVVGEFGQARTVSRGKRSFNVIEPLYNSEPVINKKKRINLPRLVDLPVEGMTGNEWNF